MENSAIDTKWYIQWKKLSFLYCTLKFIYYKPAIRMTSYILFVQTVLVFIVTK